MRQLTAVIAFLLFFSTTLLAQSGSIRGMIRDTGEKKPLANSSISLLKKTDSVLVSFTRSKEDGTYIIKNIKPGNYLLLITYPKFADFVEEIEVKDDQPISIATTSLIRKSELLKEVIYTQKLGAIRIKGDTMEFKADSFKVMDGANVEALLKKLPGIQVNSKGEITAQGERVQKVLVDGEEFFSDDPAVVTQNLRADAVDKVQVFDKKSDQSTFTGIDDGEKTKTINLTLKEDKKKGAFGKAKLSGGTPDRFENEAMVNFFKGKRKIAAFGTMANTGKSGLNWQDAERYGAGEQWSFNEDEGFFFGNFENDEFNTWGGRYNGEGLPTAWTGGVHFSNKWDRDRSHINGNYRYNKLNLEVEGNTITQYILPDTQYLNKSAKNTYNQNARHALNGFYEIMFDSSSSMKITMNGTKTNGLSQGRYLSEANTMDDRPVNRSNRFLSSEGEKKSFNSSIIWRKKFKKKGRTFSWNIDQLYNSNETEGFLNSSNAFFNSDGILFKQDTVDQRKENRSETFGLSTRVSYTEPLSKAAVLEFNYGYRSSNNQSLKSSFNKSIQGKYEVLDTLYSNDYDFRINTHTGGMNLRYNKRNIVFSAGGNISYADFRQIDLQRNIPYEYSFVNFAPKANFRYNLAAQRRISFNYSGGTRQPTLEQIQPIRENTDPLNIQIGNPILKQEFRHNLSVNFSDYKVLTSRNIYVGTNFSFTDNAISNSSFVDSVGRRTSMYVNVDGNYNFNLWSGYWMEIKKLKVSLGFNMGGNFNSYNNFLNGLKNVNNSRNINIGVNINHRKENKYDIYISPRVSRNYSTSSLRKDIVTKYWQYDGNMGGTLQLPKNFELNTEIEASFRQKINETDQTINMVRWNAYLAKKFWKNKAGEIRVSVFDILNQNIGFQRNITSNFITENKYNTIQRYFLVGFIWNFTYNPATTNGSAEKK